MCVKHLVSWFFSPLHSSIHFVNIQKQQRVMYPIRYPADQIWIKFLLWQFLRLKGDEFIVFCSLECGRFSHWTARAEESSTLGRRSEWMHCLSKRLDAQTSWWSEKQWAQIGAMNLQNSNHKIKADENFLFRTSLKTCIIDCFSKNKVLLLQVKEKNRKWEWCNVLSGDVLSLSRKKQFAEEFSENCRALT
jgi:hypothetical protein